MTLRRTAFALLATMVGSAVGASPGEGPATQMALGSDLLSAGPSPSLPSDAAQFGQLVGIWDLICDRWAADGTRTRTVGTWTFGWIVDGRMIQDVIYFFPEGHPSDRVGGTTLRYFDTGARVWKVVFFAPARNAAISLTGGVEGDRILLRGLDVDGSQLRWSFNNMSPTSMTWRGEISPDGGKTWRLEQEMQLHRRP